MPEYRNPGPIEFEAELMSDDATSGTFIEFPLDVEDLFGTRGRVPIHMTVDGAEYRGQLVSYRGRRMIGVPKAVRDEAEVAAGDTVHVVLELDEAPRVVAAPPELAEALARDEIAAAGWDAMSYSMRKEHAAAIADAKKTETQAKRVDAAISAARAKAAKL